VSDVGENEELKMGELQGELIDALEHGYPRKYALADLRATIPKITQVAAPAIAKVAEGVKKQDAAIVWEEIKRDEGIRKAFEKAAEIDRAVAIYVASKFENNRYIGTSLVKVALKEVGG